MLSLGWDGNGRVTPVWTKSQEAWPGAEPGRESPGESRSGAPEGERAPKQISCANRADLSAARIRARASAGGDVCLMLRGSWLDAPFGAPLPSVFFRGRESSSWSGKARTHPRRENEFLLPPASSVDERIV